MTILVMHWSREALLRQRMSVSNALYTFVNMKLIDGTQHQKALKNRALQTLFQRNIALCHSVAGATVEQQLERAIQTSPKHLALRLPASQRYLPGRILGIGAQGYLFAMTKAGLAYAESKQGPYSNIMTKDAFLAANERLEILNATINTRRKADEKEA